MSSVEPRDVGLVVEVFLCPSAELLSSFEVGHSYNLFGEEHTLEVSFVIVPVESSDTTESGLAAGRGWKSNCLGVGG